MDLPPRLKHVIAVEFWSRLIRLAHQSAHDVADLLDRVHGKPAQGETRSISLDGAKTLAAAVIRDRWEDAGLSPPGLETLPTVDEVLTAAAHRLLPQHKPGRKATNIPNGETLLDDVLALATRRFAWPGPTGLGAEILLDDLDEDTAVNALASYLRERRRARATKETKHDAA